MEPFGKRFNDRGVGECLELRLLLHIARDLLDERSHRVGLGDHVLRQRSGGGLDGGLSGLDERVACARGEVAVPSVDLPGREAGAIERDLERERVKGWRRANRSGQQG